MLNIFYQNETLNDTLIINVSLDQANKIETKENVVIGYNNDKVVFVNVLNASKKINGLTNGLLFPTSDLLNQIKTITGLDLANEFTNGFKVGEIESCEEVEGTHLHKCVVSIGDKKLNIVCGAPNARVGIKVVVATAGTMLPRGKAIIPGELRGMKSEGMLCSYRELAIDKPSNGIIEVDGYQLGDYFKEAYVNIK